MFILSNIQLNQYVNVIHGLQSDRLLGGFLAEGFGGPVPWEQVGELRLRRVGDAGEDVGEPGLRIDVVDLGGLRAARSAPRSDPANNHDFLPTAKPRRARSGALFVRQMRPSSRKRVKAGHRMNM